MNLTARTVLFGGKQTVDAARIDQQRHVGEHFRLEAHARHRNDVRARAVGDRNLQADIDRAQDMYVILMMQSPSERGRIQPALKAMVYDALGAN